MSFEVEQPIDPEQFNAWIGVLLQEKGQDLLRTKGILSYAGDDRRFAFQAVHMIADGDFIGPWKEGEPRKSRHRVHRPQPEPPAASARLRGLPGATEPLGETVDRPFLLERAARSASWTRSWSAARFDRAGATVAFALGDGTLRLVDSPTPKLAQRASA